MRYDTQQDYQRQDYQRPVPTVDDEVAPTVTEPTPPAPEPDAEPAGLWPADAVQDIQQRFRDVQWRFVDDPRAAADDAHALVAEALDRFSAAIESRKRELDGWRDTDASDTEQMRMVVRRYRDLLDRLLGA